MWKVELSRKKSTPLSPHHVVKWFMLRSGLFIYFCAVLVFDECRVWGLSSKLNTELLLAKKMWPSASLHSIVLAQAILSSISFEHFQSIEIYGGKTKKSVKATPFKPSAKMLNSKRWGQFHWAFPAGQHHLWETKFICSYTHHDVFLTAQNLNTSVLSVVHWDLSGLFEAVKSKQIWESE